MNAEIQITGDNTMTATTLASAQKNLSQLVSDVNDSSRPVIIVNDGGKMRS